MVNTTHAPSAPVVTMGTVHLKTAMPHLMTVTAKMVLMEQTVRITLTTASAMIYVTTAAPASTGSILTILAVILAFLAETARPTLMTVPVFPVNMLVYAMRELTPMTVSALSGLRNYLAKQTETIVQVPHVNMGFVQATAVATEDILVNVVNQKSMNTMLSPV